MNGQWMGEYKGVNTISGYAIINVDDRGDHFEGVAYIFVGDKSMPISHAQFRTNDKDKVFKLNKLRVNTIDRETGIIESWENVKKNMGKILRSLIMWM